LLSNLKVVLVAMILMNFVDCFNLTEAISRLDQSLHHLQESKLPTLDSIVEEKRQRLAEQEVQATPAVPAAQDSQNDHEGASGIEDLEDEADQQGAFNAETGEINWDCPCLGGMAHGPCGEEFKAAFSCFVYSKEEPKGMECIDKFK
jgi:mitochondrial intermembrane space import and assembly protein 40